MIRVLTDYAHADLWESMVRLFEDRFGWELYRPAGMDWFTEGIWQFEAHTLGDQVARQFLSPWHDDRDVGTHSERDDLTHPGRVMKMLTIEQARDLRPDVVVATLVENEPGLHRLAREIGATYGIQIGNQGAPNNWSQADFGLVSTTLPFRPWKPHVFYHQEFDTGLFAPVWPPAEPDLVATRVQCFTGTPDYERFRRLAAQTPELRWRHYGHCGDHDEHFGGDAPNTPEVARQMQATRIAWHVKRWSDGYGHVGFNWFAIGRPVLGSASYYADKLMGPMWVEGETSFDVDRRSDAEVTDLVRRLASDDDYHRRICESAAQRFREVVSFDAEADEIRALLDGVLSDRRVAA